MRLYLEDNLDGVQSYAVDERVHHIGRVARRARVQAEEARVISQGLGGTNSTREAYVRVLVVLVDEREHEVVDVVEATLSHIVQDRVGGELALPPWTLPSSYSQPVGVETCGAAPGTG